MVSRPPRRPASPKRFTRAQLIALIEEATVDANGDEEQVTGFLTCLEDALALPFTTTVLGSPATVTQIDLNDANEIVARCRRGSTSQRISLLDLGTPSPRPSGWEWVEAYRLWARHR